MIRSEGIALDCYDRTSSTYDGHQQTTKDGSPCIRWDSLKNRYSSSDFPDATVSQAENYCRDPKFFPHIRGPWCYTEKDKYWNICGIIKCASDSINQCGRLTTIQPTILGRNVTFSFTPDSNDPNAELVWQRTNGINPWAVLPLTYKFTQYYQDGTYYLVLTDTVRSKDEVYYKVHYYNESMHCYMETPLLHLKGEACGFVNLRTIRTTEGETVEIEYYPSNNVLNNSNNFRRTWVHSTNQRSDRINLTKDVYEEEMEKFDKFVLRIFNFSSRKTGRYGVLCDGNALYSNLVLVTIKVPPSEPTFEGLQDIDGCEKCIVGAIDDNIQVHCKTSGGTKPIDVNISVGNRILRKPQPYDKAPGHIAFFTMHAGYHMENLTFTIMNEALVSPLSATARVYVIKPPGSLLITAPKVLKEDESVNITCVSEGGRPAPKLTIDISGTDISPVHQSHYINATTALNTDVVSLTTFKRSWNQENINCCRYSEWYRNKTECSTPKQVNYLFPPSKIKLTVNVNVKGQQHEMQAICRTYESNPACVANFSVPNGIMVTEMYKKNISQPHGAWISEYAVTLNASKEYNDKVIKCTAQCTEFAVDLNGTALITFPYAPVIELNMSGPIVDIHKGEQEHVKCSAQSVPASNITWIELLDNDTDVIKNQCLSATDCVMEIDTQRVLKRDFICQAQYLKTVDQKNLTVNIIEKKEERLSHNENSVLAGKLFIWIIVGACLGVSIIVLVSFLVVKKKRRNIKAKRKSDSSNVDAVRSCRSKDEEQEEPLNRNWNQIGVQACDNPEALYSQPDKTNAATCVDATYSVVCKRSKAPTSLPQEAKDGQLIYADLDFDDSNGAPSKSAVVQRPNTPTEYVAIDFVKTAAEQPRGNQTDVAENVYANE